MLEHDRGNLHLGHRATLHRYVRRLVHDEGTAQDLAAAVLHGAGRGRPGVGQEMASWLFLLVRDELVSAARARAGVRDEQLIIKIARDAGLVAVASGLARVPVVGGGAGGGAGEAVRAALAQLRGAEQEVLFLGAWKALNSRGLGVVLGCSAGAARVRLHRARQRLRQLVLCG